MRKGTACTYIYTAVSMTTSYKPDAGWLAPHLQRLSCLTVHGAQEVEWHGQLQEAAGGVEHRRLRMATAWCSMIVDLIQRQLHGEAGGGRQRRLKWRQMVLCITSLPHGQLHGAAGGMGHRGLIWVTEGCSDVFMESVTWHRFSGMGNCKGQRRRHRRLGANTPATAAQQQRATITHLEQQSVDHHQVTHGSLPRQHLRGRVTHAS